MRKFFGGTVFAAIYFWFQPHAAAQQAEMRSVASPVSELRNQDLMFALLTEAYASVQQSMVIEDYESRLKAVQQLADGAAKKRIVQLAEAERFLREQQLAGRLKRVGSAYNYARQMDEERLGITVMANVDARAVNRYVNALVPARRREPDALVLRYGQPMVFEKYLSKWLAVPTPVEVEPPPAPRFLELLTNIRGTSDRLVTAVTELMRQPEVSYPDRSTEPALVIITYRKSGAIIQDTVVQSFEQRPEPLPVKQNWQPLYPQAVPLPFEDTFEKWITMIEQADAHSYGSPALIQERDRLLQSLWQRDLGYLRQQLSEPLYVVVLLTNPGSLLPRSLRDRVVGVLVEADLASPDWTYAVRLLAPDAEVAQQVSQQLVGWQLLAQSSVPVLSHNRVLSETLEAMNVEVAGRVIFTQGGVPAKLGWRGVDWLPTMLQRAGLDVRP